MVKKITLTARGMEKLKQELEHLKKEKRPQVAERIRVAKDYGDLSENAEYLEAKEEQAFVEGRIQEIEVMLKSADIIKTKTTATVNVGSSVTLMKDTTELRYEIVGSTEADPANGKISVDSPLGQVLIGKNKNESFKLKTPSGEIEYTIKLIQ